MYVPKTGGCSVKVLLSNQKSNENKFELCKSNHPKLFM